MKNLGQTAVYPLSQKMNLSIGEQIKVKDVPVRYEGEGSNRLWFTVLVPKKETTFTLKPKKFASAAIERKIEEILVRLQFL